MSGGAPAADASNNLFLVTGNGGFNTATTRPHDYGDSLLKLTTPALTVSQYFTPSDQPNDNQLDSGLRSRRSGDARRPACRKSFTHLLLCGGKDGSIYVLNRDLLGGYDDGHAVQKIVNTGAQIFATGAFWNNTSISAEFTEHPAQRSYQLTTSIPQFDLANSSTSHPFVTFPAPRPRYRPRERRMASSGHWTPVDTAPRVTALRPGGALCLRCDQSRDRILEQLQTSCRCGWLCG